MNLYTIIFDYRGGTYISQVYAKNANDAFIKWGKEIDPNEIQFMGEKTKDKLNKLISENLFVYDLPPLLLDDRINVWCAGPILSGSVNIIKTDEDV